jgi:hypothetical protein
MGRSWRIASRNFCSTTPSRPTSRSSRLPRGPAQPSVAVDIVLYLYCGYGIDLFVDASSVVTALKRCEEELRKLAAEAAAEGDYDTLARLGNTARTISEIGRDWQAALGAQDNADLDAAPIAREASPPALAGAARTRPGRGGARGAYPRFMRRGDELVKIGWSKGDRKEYQHRAAHHLLVALRQALLDAGKRRKLFTMEALNRQLLSSGAPGYQAYVWLAWFRSAGLVKQHGRQGYSVVKPATFEKDVDQAFAKVPVQEL